MDVKDISSKLRQIEQLIYSIKNEKDPFYKGIIWVDLKKNFFQLCDLLNFRDPDGNKWVSSTHKVVCLDFPKKVCPYCNADLIVVDSES